MRTIETKDGIVLQNVPDDVPDEAIKERIALIRSGQAPTKPDVSLLSKILRKDNDFDYSGVKDARFRAGYSRMDTPQERTRFLERSVGKGGYTQDKYKRLALTPAGLRKLGIEPKSERPVVVDESGLTRYDLADLAGDAPAIAGGLLMGTAATGVGMVPALGLAALGAAGGKGYGETVEALRGENIQGPGGVAKGLATEAALAAGGEGIYRGVLAPIGRKILAPRANQVTQGARDLTKEAQAIGAKPSASQIAKSPVFSRGQDMIHKVVGDPAAKQNQAALNAEISRLSNAAGPAVGRVDVGEAAVKDIVRSRKALSRWANIAYGKVDDLTGGKAVVSTSPLKTTAQEILDALPTTPEGAPVLTDPQLVSSLRQVLELPDDLTVGQMQAVRGRLHDAVSDNTLVPGLSSRYARTMRDAASDALNDLSKTSPEAGDLLKRVNAVYGRQIRKFDDALVKRIARDPRHAGAIPPDQLVESIFRKGQASTLGRVMPLLKPNTQAQIRRQAMDKILGSVIQRTDDPLVSVFNGKALQGTLDSYGKESIEAMFGKPLSDDLHRFARVAQFVTQKTGKSGGLVAAGIALHPWQNFGRLIQLNLMARFMNSPGGLKWLTEGLAAPKTRAGAEALSRAYAMMQTMAEDETSAPQ